MTLVLLLEDSADVAASLLGAFELRGIDVAWAESVGAARAVYSPDAFDFIVADFELPDGTGLDFLAGIRGSDKAVTILFSGLDRSRELAAAGLTVDHQISKADFGALIDLIEGD